MIEADLSVPTSLWATEKHDEVKVKVSALYTRAKNSGNQTDWLAYKRADHDFKKDVLTRQKSSVAQI